MRWLIEQSGLADTQAIDDEIARIDKRKADRETARKAAAEADEKAIADREHQARKVKIDTDRRAAEERLEELKGLITDKGGELTEAENQTSTITV